MALRLLFLILVIIHGLIHLLGFVKGFGLKEVNGLTLPISKPMGLLWLAAVLLLLLFAWFYATHAKQAWLIGIAAVVLSQALVFMYWQDAKIGTMPNLIILLVSLVLAGTYFFQTRIGSETAEILSAAKLPEPRVVTEESIKGLPDPVKHWLMRSGAVGRPFVQIGRVVQQAAMQMKPSQDNWYDASAVQYSTFDPPAFIWSVDMEMNRLLGFRGRDRFIGGKGEMLIKLNALVPLVQEEGGKIDEGSLQRYLGEVVWFPSMALSPYITWEPLTENSARATMEYAGTRGSGIFYFTPDGDVSRFTAMRYRGNEEDSSRSEWVLTVEGYSEFDGIRVPAKMTATWKLAEGDWTWLKLELIDLRFNERALE